uniref:Uncharacterized protein n=1 Tax=Ditylum brightwellii TaxID=49249 RepID=A0A6U3RJW0_9STRA|mmetsp:Transcript_11998/g.17886  ORF Transcript_11998/g.17886 Transcript_11998/m.17886 type:complete len:232 (+) Transcript_11998:248-943(+)
MPLLLPWEEDNYRHQTMDFHEEFLQDDEEENENDVLSADKQPLLLLLSTLLLLLHFICTKIEQAATASITTSTTAIHAYIPSDKVVVVEEGEGESDDSIRYSLILLPLLLVLCLILSLLFLLSIVWSCSNLAVPSLFHFWSSSRSSFSDTILPPSSILCQHVVVGSMILLLIVEGLAPILCIMYAFYLHWTSYTTHVTFGLSCGLVLSMWVGIQCSTGWVKRVLYQSMGHD